MLLREGICPRLGFVERCLPYPAKVPPSGSDWIHEIKHDGFRIMARRDGAGVRLISRRGTDFTSRFPLVAAAITALPAHSFLIDGEAIVTNGDGLAVFELAYVYFEEEPEGRFFCVTPVTLSMADHTVVIT
jgi:ATP-dependent DNA ligase